jgi:hypothetical protein
MNELNEFVQKLDFGISNEDMTKLLTSAEGKDLRMSVGIKGDGVLIAAFYTNDALNLEGKESSNATIAYGKLCPPARCN